MVYTSYYGNVPRLLAAGFSKSDFIGISRYQCKFLPDIHYELQLAPGLSYLWDLKGNVITPGTYARRYYDHLYSLDYRYLQEFGDIFAGKILLCFEKNHLECHRHLLAKFVNWYNNDLIVQEY